MATLEEIRNISTIKPIDYVARLSSLRELIKIQSQQGNWDFDKYMHGMLNGMILSAAVMQGVDPDYLHKESLDTKDTKATDAQWDIIQAAIRDFSTPR